MTSQTILKEEKVCAHNYHPLPVVLTKGSGCKLWDENGKEYLDFMSAYSAVSMGHSHPELLKVMIDQASKLAIVSRAFHTNTLAPFLEKLCQITGLDMALPMNTGAEAVETAIKAARRYGYDVKGIESGKAEIIVSKNNFHGRTTTIVGFSSDAVTRRGFEPFAPGFVPIEFGDFEALERAITPNTCAFITEPMQGEAGIIIPPKGWMKEAYELCKKHNVLFILDEVQTGMGRTGKNFAFEHEIEKPDGLILGKALGGGLFPISAFVARKEVMDVFDYGSHGSTWGGNPLASAIGLKSIEILEQENLAEQSAKKGVYLQQKLKDMNSPYIQEIRGSGLWVGVEVYAEKISAREICLKLMETGVLSKETHENVIRFAPPLIITKEEIDEAVEKLQYILESW
ncbi:MAG: ornithine--oxo-acid transaminase [Magnetococcales bacterium]|nr:ornithine--oxo-acid transaminase [Magnetococcales bacterium]